MRQFGWRNDKDLDCGWLYQPFYINSQRHCRASQRIGRCTRQQYGHGKHCDLACGVACRNGRLFCIRRGLYIHRHMACSVCISPNCHAFKFNIPTIGSHCCGRKFSLWLVRFARIASTVTLMYWYLGYDRRQKSGWHRCRITGPCCAVKLPLMVALMGVRLGHKRACHMG